MDSAVLPDTRMKLTKPNGQRVLLKDRAYAELKHLIQDATFQPGAFLSERQLAEQLGMSKTPVKAALERLEMEGFISVSPQQGIVVRELSVDEVSDQFELRMALETFIVRAVTERITAEQTKLLREAVQRQQQVAQRGDSEQLVILDGEFHMLFCQIHGNREFIRIMTQLREKIHRVISRVLQKQPDRLFASCSEHAAIVEAVVVGNSDLAAQRLQEHLDVGRQLILAPRGS